MIHLIFEIIGVAASLIVLAVLFFAFLFAWIESAQGKPPVIRKP